MADSARLTVRRRRLGRELRRIREDLGWTQGRAAGRIGRAPSSLAKVERGEQGLTHDELIDILDAYKVRDPARRQFLTKLRRDAHKKGWWNSYKNMITPATMDLISLEDDATRLRTYQPLSPPGLLQIEAYIRAILAAHIPTPADVEEGVEVRLARQGHLHGRGQETWHAQ
jgi:transcriptional regulator with XRE-family HTH domain